MSTQPLATQNAIPLEEILPQSQFIGSQPVLVKSCCSQWNECEQEDLYVAIVESEQDGHDFAGEAVKRGASAIVSERLLAVDRPQCIVDDSRTALGKICQALAGHPTERIPTFGIAGSDGKTVTSHLLRSIFTTSGFDTGLLSSIDSQIGASQNGNTNQSYNPPWLADQLSQMVINGCSKAIVEMSSVDLARRAFCGMQLDGAIITNIRTDHLQFHGSNINGRRATQRILDHLKPTGFAVVNADDPNSYKLLDQLDCPTLTIGMKQASELTARIVERSSQEQTFMILAGNESAVVRTRLIGDQQIYNCLAAAAVALTCGLDLHQIATGLSNTGIIPGRMEPIECGQSFGVWIDSSRSPNQLASALHSVAKVTPGRVWCVCSTDDSQSPEQRQHIGRIVERAVQSPVITRSKVEQLVDFEPAHQVLDGFRKPKNARVVANRLSAIEWTLEQAKPGDSVLITGAGDKPIATIEGGGWPITDRDVCQAWLYDQALDESQASDPNIYRIDDYR